MLVYQRVIAQARIDPATAHLEPSASLHRTFRWRRRHRREPELRPLPGAF